MATFYALGNPNLSCLGRIAPIVFGSGKEQKSVITNKDREKYLKLMACGPEVGHEGRKTTQAVSASSAFS